jgi:hypothetical protein
MMPSGFFLKKNPPCPETRNGYINCGTALDRVHDSTTIASFSENPASGQEPGRATFAVVLLAGTISV